MNEIRALTSLRGLAAFYVVLLHYSAAIQKHCSVTIPSLAPRGHLAVDFFFVLSGFIMAYTYAADFQQRGPVKPFADFLLKRAARLLPLHWFVTIVLLGYSLWVAPGFDGGPVPAFTTPHPGRDITLNFLLLHGILQMPNMNAPSWSISVEMAAYLCFPVFVLLLFSRHRAVRWASGALALGVMVATALQSPRLALNTLDLPMVWTLARAFAEFALGMVAYRAFAHWRTAPPKYLTPLLWMAIVLTAVMMLGRLWDLVAALMFPLIVVGVALDQGLAKRWLEHRAFHFLGLVSFSLYMVHYPVAYWQLQWVQWLHPEPLGRVAALAAATVGALSTIPLAWVSYRLIEAPGRSAIRALTSFRRRAQAGAR